MKTQTLPQKVNLPVGLPLENGDRMDRDAGVVEYAVVCVEEQELHWWDLHKRRPLRPNAQCVYCSRVFPGLWIDGPALLARDSARVEAVLRQGLASKEHAAFVELLQSRKHARS